MTELYSKSLISKRENVKELILLTISPESVTRSNASSALYHALAHYPDIIEHSLNELYTLYTLKAELPSPEYDDYGMIIPESLDKPDEYESRSGIALALKKSVPVVQDKKCILRFFEFLLGGALGDSHSTVQALMRDAGLEMIYTQCKPIVKDVLTYLDEYKVPSTLPLDSQDRIREGIVIFSGALAHHLSGSDPLIPHITRKVIDTLKTPSESVQIAVSECLVGLLKLNLNQAQPLLHELFEILFYSNKYGERKGAAYGIAGIVKGYGLDSLKKLNVLSTLSDAVQDKKLVSKRQGALFAYETLSFSLGRLFEPFIRDILSHLLVCFGDASSEVREATNDTCKTLMSGMSAHCIKLILPSILSGLDDKNWRTKTGSIEIMKNMAFLAPKQLSFNLPNVIPRLCQVLSDTHQKVQDKAQEALFTFGKVIKNPEIQSIVPILIAALVDPITKTLKALNALLNTSFVHYIDTPSLALIVPVLLRAFKERGMEVKKKSGQIIGNLAHLTDESDLVPYIPVLCPGLDEILVDPVPEVRSVSAKALGVLVEKLGENHFPRLVSNLLEKLKMDSGAVDRSGSAQGLSEVIAGLGLSRLEGLLPEIISNASSPTLFVREGFMTLFIYLPVTHGKKFTPYLESIIPPILSGFADESETVRDAAFKSGQLIVQNYPTSAIELLLPELQNGLFAWMAKVRLTCLILLGELLFKLTGISIKLDSSSSTNPGNPGNTEDSQDSLSGNEPSKKVLIHSLGLEKYNKVMAHLYMMRQDSFASVRQTSLGIWKALIVNTPKTLKEILVDLIDLVISSLASPNTEKRSVAARTLGDLVSKFGELILIEIIPVLNKGLNDSDPFVRQGVCFGMSEIMNSGKEMVMETIHEYIPLVQRALLDPEGSVREAAAKVNLNFYKNEMLKNRHLINYMVF